MKNKLLVLFFIVLSAIQYSYCQNDHTISETNSSVPELFEYHDVIYPMWHTAYPNKDYQMLKDLLPQLIAGAEKIYNVKLSGILRDKEDDWKNGVKKLHKSVDDYNEACKYKDDQKLLSAAEELHSNFEFLVRIIKPVTKEVDEFHKVLYMIYHHYAPNKNLTELNKAIDNLAMRAEELKSCVLPKWASPKKDDFLKVADELDISTKELKKLKDLKADYKQIENAIDKVHSIYQKLEALFD
jgi:hypothetical protein